MLATSLVVLIQALFFADGGLTVLGANILNISFIGAGIGGTIHYYVYKKMIQKKIYRALSLAGAAWLSVLSAAFLCSLELSFAGTISFIKVAPAMLSIHARIGIGEAGITLIAYYIFARHEKKNLVPLATAALLAMLISPFTSSWPDGLEWVAEHYNFFHASLPHIISIWKDYTFPFITEPAISTGLAGLAGVIITFILTWSIGRLFQIPLPDILYIE
jgi:cobalt/nickel transport system permease protein